MVISMAEDKSKCPVCMTRMVMTGHTLECPTCGYKYCDHNYEDRDLYDTDHSHNEYVTYTEKTPSSNKWQNENSNGRYTGAAGQRSNTGSTPVRNHAEEEKAKRARKTAKRFVYFFVFIYILPVLIRMLVAFIPRLKYLFR